MNTEGKKPVVTKAGHGAVKPVEVKKGLFSRRKKSTKPSKQPASSKISLEKTTEVKKQRGAKGKSLKAPTIPRTTKRTNRKSGRRITSPLKRSKRMIFTSVTIVLLLATGYLVASSGSNSPIGFTSSDQTGTGLLGDSTQDLGIGERPEFKVLLDQGVPAESQQYDSEIGVFFFRDELAGAIIRVNQQMLPAELVIAPNGVKNLALSKEGVSSISQLETNKGPVYLGDLEAGGQVAIFDFDNLLLFIESTSKVEATVWVEYIDALVY